MQQQTTTESNHRQEAWTDTTADTCWSEEPQVINIVGDLLGKTWDGVSAPEREIWSCYSYFQFCAELLNQKWQENASEKNTYHYFFFLSIQQTGCGVLKQRRTHLFYHRWRPLQIYRWWCMSLILKYPKKKSHIESKLTPMFSSPYLQWPNHWLSVSFKVLCFSVLKIKPGLVFERLGLVHTSCILIASSAIWWPRWLGGGSVGCFKVRDAIYYNVQSLLSVVSHCVTLMQNN